MSRLALALLLLPLSATAEETRRVLLHGPEGAVQVATLTLSAPDAAGVRGYALDWDESLFDDHFLSMRPFRCMGGAEQLWCRAPYPYEIRRRIGADLTDLEYDLIFVWKKDGTYGIDLWNGVYCQLEGAAQGPWGGMQYDYDLNALGIPPAAGELRPVSEEDMVEGPGEGRRFTRISIE